MCFLLREDYFPLVSFNQRVLCPGLGWESRCPGGRDPNYPGPPDTGVADRPSTLGFETVGEPGRLAGLVIPEQSQGLSSPHLQGREVQGLWEHRSSSALTSPKNTWIFF